MGSLIIITFYQKPAGFLRRECKQQVFMKMCFLATRITALEGIVQGLKTELESLPGPETFQVRYTSDPDGSADVGKDTQCIYQKPGTSTALVSGEKI
jgi:hypothetical protein